MTEKAVITRAHNTEGCNNNKTKLIKLYRCLICNQAVISLTVSTAVESHCLPDDQVKYQFSTSHSLHP